MPRTILVLVLSSFRFEINYLLFFFNLEKHFFPTLSKRGLYSISMFVCIKHICSYIFALPSPLYLSISPVDNRNQDSAQHSAH